MANQPPAHPTLADCVPEGLIRRLSSHFADQIEEAVQRYRFNDADEDSLTGALGHALSTPQRIVSVTAQGTFSFGVECHKILGKGPGAPESRTGADGIIQVSVESAAGVSLFKKGLPFQAKKLSRFNSSEVRPQAADMYRTSGTGIVLRFSENGYDAEDVRHFLGKHDSPLPTPTGYNPLSKMLGKWFLRCQLGKIGLEFDRQATDPHVAGKRGYWVFHTRIVKRAP